MEISNALHKNAHLLVARLRSKLIMIPFLWVEGGGCALQLSFKYFKCIIVDKCTELTGMILVIDDWCFKQLTNNYVLLDPSY